MPLIPSGITIAWPGTAASIPTGWSRVTALDAKYVKGAAAGIDPGTTGGALTHTHASPSHTHSVPSHTHASTTSGTVPAQDQDVTGGQIGQATDNAAHTHTTGVSGAQTATSNGTVATWNTSSSEPAYIEVIYIASDGSPLGFPDGAWALWNANPLPTNWSLPAAAQNRFLKGAAATGNGGGTGGTTDASHSHTAAAHTHTVGDHTHGANTTGNSAAASISDITTPGATTLQHNHQTSYAAPAAGTSSSVASAATGTVANAEPPWTKIAIAQNDTGGADAPIGIIALWTGLLASIPAGWVLCNGASGTPDLRGRYIKGVAALGELGNTGGALTHDHTDPAGHTHTVDHTHQVSLASGGAYGNTGSGAQTTFADYAHVHDPVASGAASDTGSGSGAQTVDAANQEPPYTTVAYLQLTDALEVNVSSPPAMGTVTAPALNVVWTFGGSETQASFRVRIWRDAAQTDLVYNSGTVVTSVQSHTLPATGVLQTGVTYYLQVEATDTLNVSGASSLVQFDTLWTPPGAITGLRAEGRTTEA